MSCECSGKSPPGTRGEDEDLAFLLLPICGGCSDGAASFSLAATDDDGTEFSGFIEDRLTGKLQNGVLTFEYDDGVKTTRWSGRDKGDGCWFIATAETPLGRYAFTTPARGFTPESTTRGELLPYQWCVKPTAASLLTREPHDPCTQTLSCDTPPPFGNFNVGFSTGCGGTSEGAVMWTPRVADAVYRITSRGGENDPLTGRRERLYTAIGERRVPTTFGAYDVDAEVITELPRKHHRCTENTAIYNGIGSAPLPGGPSYLVNGAFRYAIINGKYICSDTGGPGGQIYAGRYFDEREPNFETKIDFEFSLPDPEQNDIYVGANREDYFIEYRGGVAKNTSGDCIAVDFPGHPQGRFFFNGGDHIPVSIPHTETYEQQKLCFNFESYQFAKPDWTTVGTARFTNRTYRSFNYEGFPPDNCPDVTGWSGLTDEVTYQWEFQVKKCTARALMSVSGFRLNRTVLDQFGFVVDVVLKTITPYTTNTQGAFISQTRTTTGSAPVAGEEDWVFYPLGSAGVC